jgi:hypothetical protein
VVTVSTFRRDGGGSGGGGFTNAFALFIQRTSSLASMFNHCSHTRPFTPGTRSAWALFRIQMKECRGSPKVSLGITSTFCYCVLSVEEYMQRTNDYLRDYFLSPARNLPNTELIERRHHVGVDDDLVYTRGAVTAQWLDWAIRNSTRGKSSLNNVMFDLVRQAHGTVLNWLLNAFIERRVSTQMSGTLGSCAST